MWRIIIMCLAALLMTAVNSMGDRLPEKAEPLKAAALSVLGDELRITLLGSNVPASTFVQLRVEDWDLDAFARGRACQSLPDHAGLECIEVELDDTKTHSFLGYAPTPFSGVSGEARALRQDSARRHIEDLKTGLGIDR